MTVRAAIFDLDGLLVDSEPLWERATARALARHGHSYESGVAADHIGLRLADLCAAFRAHYGLAVPAEEFGRDVVDALLDLFRASLAPMPGAERALDLAASLGLELAVASSSMPAIIDAALDRFGWRGRLGAVCSGEEVERGKPAPDVFLLAAARLGVAPEACVALEDSRHGVRAARAAGMRCVAVPHPGQPDAGDGADVVLASLEELAAEHLGAGRRGAAM